MNLKLSVPAGVAGGTEYQTAGRWFDANLVRWYGAELGPIGGWTARSTQTVDGAARAMLAWRDNGGVRHIMIGTHSGLYVQTAAGAVVEVTPAGFVSGHADGGAHSGYGGGAYGGSSYGTPRPDTGEITDATVWDLDTFGERPVGCSPDDGTLYWWDLDLSDPAEAVANAPTGCFGVAVTEQRAVMAFGAGGDARNVAWSDLEDAEDWTPDATNQAGDFDITTTGTIIKGLRLGPQMLILTTIDAHVAEYIGPPFVYGFRRVGHGCGGMSKGCAVAMGQQAVWWGRSGFWMYDGGAVQPVPCDLQDFLRGDLNRGQRSKVTGFHNARFGEVTWFYPSASSLENDAYVTWSYRQGWWTKGRLTRLCAVEEGAFNFVLAVDAQGTVHEHETGGNFDGALPFAESGPVEIGDGDQVMKVEGLIADEATAGQVRIGFFARAFPNAAETEIAPVVPASTGKTDLRFAARQARMRVTFTGDETARFGTPRLMLSAGGRR